MFQYMNTQRTFFSYVVPIIAGISILPFISWAWIPDDLRKIHDESIEQRDARREQFKQDILEKRKEVLSKWADRKQEFEETLNKEREKIKSGFELRRTRKEADRSSATTTEIQDQGVGTQGGFFSFIKKGTQDIAHFFSPLKDLFGNGER